MVIFWESFDKNHHKIYICKVVKRFPNAEPERGFSTLKNIKTPKRNRLEDVNLEHLMTVALKKDLDKEIPNFLP